MFFKRYLEDLDGEETKTSLVTLRFKWVSSLLSNISKRFYLSAPVVFYLSDSISHYTFLVYLRHTPKDHKWTNSEKAVNAGVLNIGRETTLTNHVIVTQVSCHYRKRCCDATKRIKEKPVLCFLERNLIKGLFRQLWTPRGRDSRLSESISKTGVQHHTHW